MEGYVSISRGIDHPLCKNGLPSGFTLGNHAPDGIALHYRIDDEAMQQRVNTGFLNHLVGYIFKHVGIQELTHPIRDDLICIRKMA